MAQRFGAGGAFQQHHHHHHRHPYHQQNHQPPRPPQPALVHERIDDHLASFRPSSRNDREIIYYDDSPGYDSDEPSPYRRQHGGLSPERSRSWTPSPSPEHQFFILSEGTPPPSHPPPTRSSQDASQQHLQPQPHPYSNSTRHVHPPRPRISSHPSHHHESANVFPSPVACLMERTSSGRTILTETTAAETLPATDPQHIFSPDEDRAAARRVKYHMLEPAQRVRHHERILRGLIHPRSGEGAADFPLDQAALQSIFRAADEIFFQGTLSRRVHWEWSSNEQQQTGGSGGRIIGTTALRHATGERGGYETLIVLSSPILTDTSYNRRLLISTFLHELIHSYLFICCGFKARHCGGHTDGFLEIAKLIDVWAGEGTLMLSEVEANLDHFREEPLPPLPEPPLVMVDELPRLQQQQQQQQTPPNRHHRHQRGGADFYTLNDPLPWSAGPRVVFGAHEQAGGEWGLANGYSSDAVYAYGPARWMGGDL